MCSDTTIYLDAMGDATIDTSFFDLTFSDNCTISTLTLSKAVFTCIDVGTPMVTITATDGYGNSATCTATVTVRDTISPVVMCMDKTIYLSAAGTATIDSSYIMASATDACGIMSVVPSQTSFSCTDIGTNTVALTAHDKNGNSSMCTATVTVRDTISPVVTCMDTTIYLDVNGMAVIDSSFVVSSAIDACSSVTLSLGQTSFTCGDLGTQEVTISATDANDNTSTCTANVTILKTPLMTTQIAGPSTICPGLSQIAYSASTITGATAYQWSYAGTGVSINNNGSNQITLDFASDATAGILTVDVIDACGDVSSSATHAIQIESGAICTLVDCARDGIYIDDELLALIGSLDVYRASQSIESDATILSDRNLVFKAGQAITFYPGFNVEQGGVLEAIIEACGE